MTEIINNTRHPLTFHHENKEGEIEITILPFDSGEIPDNLWKKFKKNKTVKEKLENKSLVVREKQNFFKKLFKFS